MSTDKRFSHESLQDAKTIKTLLSALSKGFAKGQLSLGDDDETLVLQTADLMTLRLKGECVDGRCTVRLRVSWTEPDAPETRDAGKPRIGS
jgi:amphi-Trp domain-containing protein